MATSASPRERTYSLTHVPPLASDAEALLSSRKVMQCLTQKNYVCKKLREEAAASCHHSDLRNIELQNNFEQNPLKHDAIVSAGSGV